MVLLKYSIYLLLNIYQPDFFAYIAGLTVGDPVFSTGAPLSVELGPGKKHSQSLILIINGWRGKMELAAIALSRSLSPSPLSLPFSLNSYLFINYCLGIMEGIFDGI